VNRRSLLSLTALLLAAQAQVPRSLDELWADFPRLNADTPLETEALKEWERADVVCRIVRL